MQVFDERWIIPTKKLTFRVAEVFRLMKSLTISKEERELFFQNEIENPVLTYTPADLSFTDITDEVENLQAAIGDSDTHSVVADLYARKLKRQLDRQALLRAVTAGDDEAVHAASVTLYGAPKKEYFAYVAKRVSELCESMTGRFPSEVKRLQKVFTKISVDEVSISADILPPPAEQSPHITSRQQVVDIFTATLARVNLLNWSIGVRPDNHANFAVYPSSQRILIPREEQLLARSYLTERKVAAIAEHEIGVHARRSAEGYQQPLRLLGLGLDDYLTGEEGLASYVQQQVEGASEFYGFDRYLAASLAMGLDGTPRDFRGVFRLMVDFYTLFHADDADPALAVSAAWRVCVRIFRGTSGHTPGAIYTKDIVYLEGNIGIWYTLIADPARFDSFFLGKYNPLNERHVKSLQTLEIM